jgi:DNA-directed RNA polymerase specialized sigma24 family protein
VAEGTRAGRAAGLVIRVALNAHVSWWRRHRREVALGGHDATAAASQDPGLDGSLVAALRRLPIRQRQVIALRLLRDLDTATTAEMLGMSGSTVTTHLHRPVATLRCDIRARYDQEITQ